MRVKDESGKNKQATFELNQNEFIVLIFRKQEMVNLDYWPFYKNSMTKVLSPNHNQENRGFIFLPVLTS